MRKVFSKLSLACLAIAASVTASAQALNNQAATSTGAGNKSETRTFVDFKIDFRTDPYTVVAPEEGLPEGVVVTGVFHDSQHGYQDAKVTVAVDGPVKLTIGGCQYTSKATVSVDGGATVDIDTKSAGCDKNFGTYTKYAVYTYNSKDAATLTINLGSYCPYLFAEACEYVQDVTVSYYDTDGTLLGNDVVTGSSELAFKYTESDVTVAEGEVFRGWFDANGIKQTAGKQLTADLALYAKATPVENPTVGSTFAYDLTTSSFYPEDHEAFSSTGKYHNTHGFTFGKNQNVTVKTAGNAILVFGTCRYGNEGTIVVTDANGTQVGNPITVPSAKDGANASIIYNGEPTTLTATFTNGGYLHSITVYNVEKAPTMNSAGYYEIEANDSKAFQLALVALQEGDKIFLPNGTYDLGEKTLTTISANNVSIIGESMEGTIIRNCPPKEKEGIGTTATLLNTSDGLYMQDLTIQNALDYYATGSAGRAVCLQDKGSYTICKNVKMLSYQDTYYSNSESDFYWEDSEIHGTVDYLCGDGNVLYNRCKLVNESRVKGAKTGTDVIAAPYTSASCLWGYVFLNCSVESNCDDFTLARSWGGESKAQFINTTLLDNTLNESRFSADGMNVAAYKFKEYNTMDAEGNVISPESKVINFTHSTGNKEYETILTAEEAAGYTIDAILGEWKPDRICAQVTETKAEGVFLIDGQITTTAPTTGKARIANLRGGFGPEVNYTPTAVKDVKAPQTGTANGKYLSANGIAIIKNGKKYNIAGVEIK